MSECKNGIGVFGRWLNVCIPSEDEHSENLEIKFSKKIEKYILIK